MISLSELLNMEMEPEVFIVDKILPPGVTLLCGTQKIGKSWLALKLCLCVAAGIDFWGYKTLHCKALYCCLEDPYKRIRKRYLSLLEEAEELQGFSSTDWVHFERDMPPLNEGLVDRLEEYVKENPECKLIIIDTLLMIMPPMNDAPYVSDYKNIVAFKNFVERHEIAIVIIHHTRKLKAKDPFQEIVGTGGLAGAADTMMLLSREGRNSGKGKLVYTGRDLEDQEISLEFHKGDWRLAIETDVENDEMEYEDWDSEENENTEGGSGEFAQMIIDVLDEASRWEGTATEFSDATGGRIKSGGVVKKLKKCRHELEQRGIVFNNGTDGKRRTIVICRLGEGV